MDHVTLDRKELIAALPALKRALPKVKPFKEWTKGCGRFSYLNGCAVLSATDAEMSTLSREFKGQGIGAWVTAIPLASLSDFAKASTDETIRIEADTDGPDYRVRFIDSMGISEHDVPDVERLPNARGQARIDAPDACDSQFMHVDAKELRAELDWCRGHRPSIPPDTI